MQHTKQQVQQINNTKETVAIATILSRVRIELEVSYSHAIDIPE